MGSIMKIETPIIKRRAERMFAESSNFYLIFIFRQTSFIFHNEYTYFRLVFETTNKKSPTTSTKSAEYTLSSINVQFPNKIIRQKLVTCKCK